MEAGEGRTFGVDPSSCRFSSLSDDVLGARARQVGRVERAGRRSQAYMPTR